MVEIVIKDTGIRVTCKTYEEAFWVYNAFSNKFTIIIEGEELRKRGPIESKNPHVSAYFSGYTRGYFEKFFK